MSGAGKETEVASRKKGLFGSRLTTAIFLCILIVFSIQSCNEDEVPSVSAGTDRRGGEATPAEVAPSEGSIESIGVSDSLDGRDFRGATLGGLSALAYDPRRDVYYALVDRRERQTARFYTLRLPLGDGRLGEPRILGVTVLQDPGGRPLTTGRFDGEGIAVDRNGEILVSSETEPSIRRFSTEGAFLGELPVPKKFLVAPRGGGSLNGTFEGLSLTPDGNALFVALQKPLASDGSAPGEKRKIRLLRYERRGSGDFKPSGEYPYETNPEGSITDVVAVSGQRLLVVDSGARIFGADLSDADDVSDRLKLANSSLATAESKLLVNLFDCVAGDAASPRSAQTYEGIAFGPPLPDNGRSLLLISDDNFEEEELTRLLALGVRPWPPDQETEYDACE